ncbi:sugar phosphate nucleotidyltransferase [Planctomycetota bacterium]
MADRKALSRSPLRSKWAVILCGGRGSRLGKVSDGIPKSLVEVHGKPLLWYTVLTLFKHGFRHFIFPLGYKGEQIEAFITREFEQTDCEMRFPETGLETPIGKRLSSAVRFIPEGDDFFLLNGDTFFDFDITRMFYRHRRANAWLTLSSVEIISSYGLILQDGDGRIRDFSREQKVSHFSINGAEDLQGYVNAGIVWLNKKALSLINLETTTSFEQDLFPRVIRQGRAVHHPIEGEWFAIDTPKDLNIINMTVRSQQEIGNVVKKAKKDLLSRYSYRTRYFSNADAVREKILNKTIIPHQVEVQPGPVTGNICWLKCPYCYGRTAADSGERLAPDRYTEIMRQIAEGGVNKIVYAGYATDPLNYRFIEDLLQVSLDYGQIFGFHTKAIKISERMVSQLTQADISPMSYFSISVDAGTNGTYNRYHGVERSTAKIYDRVRENLARVAEARARTSAPLDISATYLVSGMNNSEEEIAKAIRELREAGADLVRFTFPQKPRGYSTELAPYIPERDAVESDMKRLRPLIEAENSDQCQVLIMDLDANPAARNPRTLPCFARFVFPSIGFDGWLSHCSESAAPHFRQLAIGDLNRRDFWDIFYEYDAERFGQYLAGAAEKMNRLKCKCDRKEHVVNARLGESGEFDGLG